MNKFYRDVSISNDQLFNELRKYGTKQIYIEKDNYGRHELERKKLLVYDCLINMIKKGEMKYYYLIKEDVIRLRIDDNTIGSYIDINTTYTRKDKFNRILS